MSNWSKKLLPLLFIFALSGFAHLDGIVQSGGEIPWPLSNQEVVTASNSKGLWSLSNQNKNKIYNLEIVADPRSGFDWIRVAELHNETWEVISWGEGFFSQRPMTLGSPSSYFDVTLSPGGGKDKLGRYLTMFPNGDLKKDPYLVRLVEVKTAVGNVLGLSIIDYVTLEYDHYLGQRMMKESLNCYEESKDRDNLVCHFYY